MDAAVLQALTSTPAVDVTQFQSLAGNPEPENEALVQGQARVLASLKSMTMMPLDSNSENLFQRFDPQFLKGLPAEKVSAEASHAVYSLAELHIAVVLEIARLGYVIQAGHKALLKLPEYKDNEPLGATIAPQMFAEIVQEGLISMNLGEFAEGAAAWDEKKCLQKAGKRFSQQGISATTLDEVLLQGSGLDLATRVAISDNTQAAFELLPPAGRALYVAVTRMLAGKEAVIAAAVLHLRAQPAVAPVRAALRKVPAKFQTQDQDLIRWMMRLSLLVAMELHVYHALLEVYQALRKISGWADPEVPLFQYTTPQLMEALKVNNERFEHTALTFGGTVPVVTEGANPPASCSNVVTGTVTASDGMRFLESQMRAKTSNYKMPKADSPQQQWVNWFSKVEGLAKMFPIPHQIIIENLLTGIADDDVRIYGWKSKCERFMLDGQQWGMHEFLSHVRGQVLSTVTTRKAAWEELSALKDNYGDLTDCVALGTHLRKLYQQIYDVSSSEIEPVSRIQCLRCIHKLLTDIHTRGRNVYPIARAWKGFTLFDSTKVFLQYVDQDKHTPENTVRLSEEYLTEMCSQLSTAHDIYTQMGTSLTGPVQHQDRHHFGQGRGRSINQVSFHRGAGRRAHSFHPSAGDRQKRSRSTESARSGASARSTRGRTETRPSRGGASGSGRGARGEARDKSAPKDASFAEVVEVLCQQKPAIAPPYLRELAGMTPVMTQAECLAAIRTGKCILCQGPHTYGKCPLLQEGHALKPQAEEWLQEYRRARVQAREQK